ncbi:hypothetical protein K1719_022837 [Acacia pycnantha]|nr:hypothetical protein K1719_022837 [Acacia pycnantha]
MFSSLALDSTRTRSSVSELSCTPADDDGDEIGGIYFWTYVYRFVRIFPENKISNINSDDDPNNNNIPPLPSSSDPITPSTKNKVRKSVEKIGLLIKDIAMKHLNLKSLINPSNIAVIVGLTIGITPFLRKVFVGPSAPLHILHGTASLLGAAFIPTITLITGANLQKGLWNKTDLKYSAIVLIGVIRYVVMPIIGVAIVKGGVRLGMIPSDEPLYQLVLLLQHSVPPAINMTSIVQLNGVGEKECSVILLATYVAAPAALTLWSTFYMWLVLGQHL